MNQRTFAFVFARGGSKGLPGKNIKQLGGIPLIAHSIRLARSMRSIQRVFVSTDCEDIAAVAHRFGAEVIERPAELASDTAAEWHAWQHAVKHLRMDRGLDFDIFLSLPATSPLRHETDVQRCLDALDGQTDAVITVSPSTHNPYFTMVSMDERGFARHVLGTGTFTRRQDLPQIYGITAVAYVSRPNFILAHQRLFDGQVRPVLVPKERAVDIDDEFDFKVAQALL